MTASDLVNLSGLMDDAKCFAFVRQRRWPEGIRYPACDNDAVICDGHDHTQPCRRRYRCKACSGRFDDLTGTMLAGHHQPVNRLGKGAHPQLRCRSLSCCMDQARPEQVELCSSVAGPHPTSLLPAAK